MLQIKNVTKDYVVTKDLTVHALKGVSLNFRKSEFVSILGPSGCGKTTLLNMIGGLDRYNDGDISIDGKSTKDFRDSDWDTYRNRSIGFVFQSYNLIPNMNVLDNVLLSLSVAGESRSRRVKRAKEALYKVGLINQIKKYPRQLSGGQMQRVAIARAIVNDPEVILADEPTGALDSETGVQVMELLKKISADRLVIMVTHNQELADQYSTRIVKMVDGKLVDDSNPYEGEEALPAEQIDDLKKYTESTLGGGRAELNGTITSPPKAKSKATESKAVKSKLQKSKTSKSERRKKKSRMSLFTAFAISFKNLKVKLGRTLLISFAGSIGIFGIALVLAVSGGMGDYVDYLQREAVEDGAIQLGEQAYSVARMLDVMGQVADGEAYPDIDGVIPWYRESFNAVSELSDEFAEYIENIDRSWIKTIKYTYNLQMHVLENTGENSYTLRSGWANYARQMIEEEGLIEQAYDVLYKSKSSQTGYPQDYTEVSFVVDSYNRIHPNTLNALGISYTRHKDGTYDMVSFKDIVDREYELVLNDGWYVEQENGTFKTITGADYANISPENKVKVKIVSVLRVKNNDATQWLSSGIAYLPELARFLIEDSQNSTIGQAQINATDHSVLTGTAFTVPEFGTQAEKNANVRTQYKTALKAVGAYSAPVNIYIYPTDIDAQQNITAYIDAWNNSHGKDQQVEYLGLLDLAVQLLSTFIDLVTYVLIGFSGVSLIVSTVMISVITYTSVMERIKTIGVLRSIGARKKDIANLFNTETLLIGTFAGVMGVVLSLLIGKLANYVLTLFLGVAVVQFTWQIVAGMLALSIVLTLLAGLIPAVIAAKKDPVTCLRNE